MGKICRYESELGVRIVSMNCNVMGISATFSSKIRGDRRADERRAEVEK